MQFKIQNLANFTYKELEKVQSPINGEITVYTVFGSPRMTIDGLLQSGGIIAEIWKKAIKQISDYQLQIKNILILGLGCGTAAQIFSKRFPQAKITGVEIDPKVIKLGKKYFGLGEIPYLEVVCENAIKFVTNYKLSIANYFGLIIVDLYLGKKIPPRLQSLSFLSHLRNLSRKRGIVIFNRIFWDEHRQGAEVFVKKAEKIFPKVELVRTVANLLVICRI